MKFEKLKQLKNTIEKNDFYSNYNGVQNGAYIFSFIAQATIIFFGYYFISSLIKTAEPDLNPLLVNAIAFIFLFGFETLKRTITDKWAKDTVEFGAKMRAGFLTLSVVSLALYAGSFYFTLSGAGKWSDKTEQIENQSIVNISTVKDSLSLKYNTRIQEIKDERTKLEQQFQENSTVKSYNQAVAKYTERGWRTDKALVETLKPSYQAAEKRFNDNATKLDQQITKIENDRDTDLIKTEERLTTKTKQDSAESKDASSSFIKWSIAFEFVVMFGIYFRRYFQYKAVQDWDERIKSDPKLNRWYRYDRLLEVLYQTKTKTLDAGAQLPIAKDLAKMATLEGGLLFTDGEINTEYYKLLNNLGVIVTRGSKRYIQLNYGEAKKALAKQFDIATEE